LFYNDIIKTVKFVFIITTVICVFLMKSVINLRYLFLTVDVV